MPLYITESNEVEFCHIGRREDGTWFCSGHSVWFEDRDEYERHKDEDHPVFCDNLRTVHDSEPVLAAYRYQERTGNVNYCATCADAAWDSDEQLREKVERQPRSANTDADRLHPDHPLEQRLTEGNE